MIPVSSLPAPTRIELFDIGPSDSPESRVMAFAVSLDAEAQAFSSSFCAPSDRALVEVARSLMLTLVDAVDGKSFDVAGYSPLLWAHLESAWLFATAAQQRIALRQYLARDSRNSFHFYVSLLRETVLDADALFWTREHQCLIKASFGAAIAQPRRPFAIDCHGLVRYESALARYGDMEGLAWIEDPSDANEVHPTHVPVVSGERVTDWERELSRPRTRFSDRHWAHIEPARCGGARRARDAAVKLERMGVPILIHGHQPYIGAHLAAATLGIRYVEINGSWLDDRFRVGLGTARPSVPVALRDLERSLDRPGGGPEPSLHQRATIRALCVAERSDA